MQKVILNNGVEMPILGYGVFLINDKKECEQCVCDALVTGYRLIDTAAGYENEEAVGNGIKRSGIPREENNIQMEAWGPLAQGNYNIFHNEVLMSIGKKYRKSVSQVTLRWLIQRGIVAIPKSVHKERMVENFNIFDFELNQEDMSKIASMDTNKSIFHDLGEIGFLKACHDFRNPT